jgi:hypothetical protein
VNEVKEYGTEKGKESKDCREKAKRQTNHPHYQLSRLKSLKAESNGPNYEEGEIDQSARQSAD